MKRRVMDVDEMAEGMIEDRKSKKDRIGFSEATGEFLKVDIANRMTAFKHADKQGRVDLNDIEQVKERTYQYFEACAAAGEFPSVMNLSVYAFGISRQALNQYLLQHNNATTEFIARVKDVIADTLVNASMQNKANVIQTIFQLKNHYEHTDRVEILPNNIEPENVFDAEAIRRKYLTDDDE